MDVYVYVFYGFPIGEDLPSKIQDYLCEDHRREGDWDWKDYLCHKKGLEYPPEGCEKTVMNKYWKRQEELADAEPCKISFAGSDVIPDYFVCVKESHKSKAWEYIRIPYENTRGYWEKDLIDFCKLMDIPYDKEKFDWYAIPYYEGS